MKYSNLNLGQIEALVNILGLDNVEALLRGEKKVSFEDVVKLFFDRNGRAIPFAGIKSTVVDSNRDYHLTQPTIDYDVILCCLQEFFAQEMKFVSVAEFAQRANALIDQIRADKQVANLLKGVYLPFCLPQIKVGDYGATLEEKFLPAVKRAYENAFPNLKFNNYRAGELSGQVGIVEESRHQQLVERMTQEPVVGIYFLPFQGFSIPADRELIETLPKGFILSGALDTATVLTAFPKTLARDYQTPKLDCAANTWQSAELSLCFCADGDELDFFSGDLGADGGGCSGGLSFFG